VLELAEALDLRDSGTARHSHAVGSYAELMAGELDFAPSAIERMRLAGLLHDIGKICVPDPVLRKPGALTGTEWEEIRRHPEIGARIVARPGLENVRVWVIAHHERPEGRGYHYGLRGDLIPLQTRILSAADVTRR
jgi:putative nucleotidyltransferase with HDIG domain